MNFYAYYPASASGFGAPSVTAGSAISSEITVQRNVTGQTDFLAANSGAVLSKPLTGALALNFTHIMSKVGFCLTQEVGTTTTIQQFGFENLINKGTYDYVGSVWQTLVNTNKGSFDDYVAVGAANAVEMEGTGAKENVRSDNEFYMFIPQAGGTTADKVALWDGTGTADANGVLAPDNAYISMIYRTHKPGVTPLDVLGYAERSSSTAETEWSEGSNAAEYAKYKKGGTYTGELFIKVGFKMEAAQLSWLNGKGYTYNMLLNQAGGLYLSEYYFDEDGNNTKIRVTGSPDVTDPVFGTDIMFDVTVSDWDNITPETEI